MEAVNSEELCNCSARCRWVLVEMCAFVIRNFGPKLEIESTKLFGVVRQYMCKLENCFYELVIERLRAHRISLYRGFGKLSKLTRMY
jgi:hypothetical protein